MWCWQRHQDSTEWGAWNKRPETQTNDIVEHNLLHNVPNDTRILYHSDWGLAVSRDGKIKSLVEFIICYCWWLNDVNASAEDSSMSCCNCWLISCCELWGWRSNTTIKCILFNIMMKDFIFSSVLVLLIWRNFMVNQFDMSFLNSYYITLSINHEFSLNCNYPSHVSMWAISQVPQLSAILAFTAARRIF